MSFFEPGKFPREHRKLLDGFMELRSDDRCNFDEIVGEGAHVHMEMMSDDQLWVSLSSSEQSEECVTLWITAKKGKLQIVVSDDE